MSEDEIEKWSRDERGRDFHVSPSCSSFEVLDPHDPVISRLATQLFRKTNDYLQGEMSAGQDHYTLLEEINRLAITKYADLRNLAVNLGKTLNEYNEIYNQQIKPLLQQIDVIESQVTQFEANAYKLDSYTKQLKARFKELEEKWIKMGTDVSCGVFGERSWYKSCINLCKVASIFQAEVYAIMECANANLQKHYLNQNIFINSDSQAPLLALNCLSEFATLYGEDDAWIRLYFHLCAAAAR